MARVGRRGDGNALDGGLPAGDRLGRGVADDVGSGDERDRLGRRVPQPHDAETVEQQDSVGDVLEHPGRVRALFYLAVEPRAVEREGEPCGEVLGKRDVLGRVHRPALGPCQREHAEPLLACAKGDGDDRARLEAAERYGLGLRALVEGREDAGAAPLEDGSDLGFRLIGGHASAVRAGRRSTRDCHAAEVVRVIGDVDQAPVGEVDHDQLRDPHQRAVEVDPGGDLVPDVSEQVQPRAALRALGGGLSLRGLEQLASVVAALQLPHVAQEGLDVERLPFRVAHRGAVLAHPDGTAVPREQAVLERADGSAGARALELRDHTVAVVGVQEAKVEVGLLDPLRRGVTRHLRDRRRDVERLCTVARRREPRHERQAVEQGVVPRLGGLELLDPCPLPRACAPCQQQRERPAGQQGHRCDEDALPALGQQDEEEGGRRGQHEGGNGGEPGTGAVLLDRKHGAASPG